MDSDRRQSTAVCHRLLPVVLIIISIICSLTLILIINYQRIPHIRNDVVRINVTQLEQYRLRGNIRVTVYNDFYSGLKVDIRRFKKDRPTNKGIILSRTVFDSLVRVWSNITDTVYENGKRKLLHVLTLQQFD